MNTEKRRMRFEAGARSKIYEPFRRAAPRRNHRRDLISAASERPTEEREGGGERMVDGWCENFAVLPRLADPLVYGAAVENDGNLGKRLASSHAQPGYIHTYIPHLLARH